MPPVVTTSAWRRGAVDGGRPRSPPGRRGTTRALDREPEAREARLERVARGVLADAGRGAVAGGEDERRPRRARRSSGRASASRRSGPPTGRRAAAAVARCPAPRRPAGRRGASHVAALAAGLRDEPDGPDLDAALDALDHVVDRQGRDRRRGHRLHLDAGRAGRRGLGPDAQDARGPIRA